MATVAQWLGTLTKYKGLTESPPGSNRQPFAPRVGHLNGYAWCASYVAACAREAGVRLPSESAWTPSMADGFRRTGRWYPTGPRPGDVVFFDFPNDNQRRIQHVGVVVGVEPDGRVRTIEGNTSPDERGSQADGGGVFTRLRSPSLIVGYGRPDLEDRPAPPLKDIDPQEVEMAHTAVRPQGGYIIVAHDGGVFAYRGAPYLGSIPGLNPRPTITGNIVTAAWTATGQGYWLVGTDGAVYAFGDAPFHGGFNQLPAATRGRRYAVGIVPLGKGYVVVTHDPSNDGSPYDEYGFGV